MAATRDANRNQIFTDYDRSKIFIFNNYFESATYTNSTGSEKTLAAGTVLGKIAATGLVVPLDPAGVDGSQYPCGILTQDVTVANGASATVNYGISGDVNENAVVLDGGEALTDVIELKTIADRIKSDTMGIRLVATLDHTNFDN